MARALKRRDEVQVQNGTDHGENKMVTKNVSISNAAKVVVRRKAAKARSLQREQLKAAEIERQEKQRIAEIERQEKEIRAAKWEQLCNTPRVHNWSDDPRD